jgi:hypothetical protein
MSQESLLVRGKEVLASIQEDANGRLVSVFGPVKEEADPRQAATQAVAAIKSGTIRPFSACSCNSGTGVCCCVDGHIEPTQVWCSG